MRWNEIICEAKVVPAETALKKDGWRKIGKGAYASVFEHPNKNYVLKLFSNEDTAYMEFVNLVKQQPNEHFPKFGSITKSGEDHWTTVEIEKLQPITPDYRKDVKVIGNLIAMFHYMTYEEIVRKIKEEEGYDHWQNYVTYLDDHPTMKEAISILMPLLKKHFCDLGESNFMLRGDILVFTDPVETIR